MVPAVTFPCGKERRTAFDNVETVLAGSRLELGCCMTDQNWLLTHDLVVAQVLVINGRTGHRTRGSREVVGGWLEVVLIQMRLARLRHDSDTTVEERMEEYGITGLGRSPHPRESKGKGSTLMAFWVSHLGNIGLPQGLRLQLLSGQGPGRIRRRYDIWNLDAWWPGPVGGKNHGTRGGKAGRGSTLGYLI